MSQRAIAQKFKIMQPAVFYILKTKENILKAVNVSPDDNTRKMARMKFPEVESAALSWLKRCIAKNVPISGPLIQREAERGAQKLGITTLKASNGWLQRFRQRNEVLFKSRSGEGADLDKDVVQR